MSTPYKITSSSYLQMRIGISLFVHIFFQRIINNGLEYVCKGESRLNKFLSILILNVLKLIYND